MDKKPNPPGKQGKSGSAYTAPPRKDNSNGKNASPASEVHFGGHPKGTAGRKNFPKLAK